MQRKYSSLFREHLALLLDDISTTTKDLINNDSDNECCNDCNSDDNMWNSRKDSWQPKKEIKRERNTRVIVRFFGYYLIRLI